MQRNERVDNLKGIAILLVVFFHFMEVLSSKIDIGATMAQAWHMPLFIGIAGFLTSKTVPASRAIYQLAIPYVLMQTLLAAFDSFVGEHPFHLTLLEPSWAMWYIVVLMTIRLAWPLLTKLPGLLPISLGVAAVVGLTDPNLPLALPNTLVLLPFFVVGYRVRHRWTVLTVVTRVKPIAPYAIILSAVLGLSYYLLVPLGRVFPTLANSALLTGAGGELAMSQLTHMSMRLGVFGWVFFLYLISPRTKSWLSSMGVHTFNIYLLHQFIVNAISARGMGLTTVVDAHPVIALITVAAASILITKLLSTQLFVNIGQWLYAPHLRVLKLWNDRKQPDPAAPPVQGQDLASVG